MHFGFTKKGELHTDKGYRKAYSLMLGLQTSHYLWIIIELNLDNMKNLEWNIINILFPNNNSTIYDYLLNTIQNEAHYFSSRYLSVIKLTFLLGPFSK